MPIAVRKLLLVLLVLLALLCIAGFVYAKFWLEPFLKETLEHNTTASSQGLYALKIDRLSVHLWTGSAEVEGIALSTDSIRWDSLRLQKPGETPLKIDLQIRRLRFKNFSYFQYWRKKDLYLDKIQISDPNLELSSIQDTLLEKSVKAAKPNEGMLDRLPSLIAPFANSLHIGSVTTYNGKITYHSVRENKKGFQQADSIHIVLTGINILAKDTIKTGKALYADNISLSLNHYEWYPSGDLYGYRINSATLDEQAESIQLKAISILPKLSDEEFMQRLKLRIPRLKINMDEILIHKFDLYKALHEDKLTMESAIVETARIKVYQNKNLPLSQHKRMPHELFQSIKTYLNIDTILIRNSNIRYTELQGDQTGELEFEHLNGVILNISNDTLKMSDATPACIDARAELMGAGLLDLSLKLPLLAQNFRCDFSANLGKIDMTYLNRLVEDQNKFRVESGNAESMTLKVQVRNGLAQGSLEAIYNNLKISVLRQKDGSKKKLISAVANIVLRGKNEPGLADHPFKIGAIYYRREPTDGILRFIWRSAQTGLMATLIPSNIKLGKMPD